MHPTRAYVLFTLLTALGMGAGATAYTPFLLSIPLSFADIALLNAAFWAAIVVAELPTGMWADGKSRIWSMHCGTIFLTIGSAAYACATGFWSALLGEVLAGIGFAFLSGAQQAWLVDALISRGEGDEETRAKAFSHAMLARGIGVCLGGVLGAVSILIHPRCFWIVRGSFYLAALLLARTYMSNTGEPQGRVSEKEAFTRSWGAVRASSQLRWAVMAFMAFGLVMPFNHLWVPFLQSRTAASNIPWLWVPMYASVAAPAVWIRRRGIKDGRETRDIIFALLLTGCSMMVASYPHGLTLPFALIMLHEMGRGLLEPLIELFTHRRIESPYRATYGSLHSFLGRTGNAFVLLIVWLALRNRPSDETTIRLTWTGCGALLSVAALVLYIYRVQEERVLAKAQMRTASL